MKKMIVSVVVALFVVPSLLHASVTFTFGTQGTTSRAYGSDTVTLLPSSAQGFVQLLYLGADGIYNGLSTANAVGTQGDDLVVATSYIGQNIVSATKDGRFTGTWSNTDKDVGSKVMMRFFDTATSSFGSGVNAPIPSTGFCGTSQTYTTTQNPFGTPQSETFYFNANYSATTAVPEPTTIALMMAGIGMILGRKLLRS